MTTTLSSFHEKLICDLFDSSIADTDAFLVFHILHEFEIHVRLGVLSDCKEPTLAAVTQRHAASCLAALWRGSRDERRSSQYWYRRWNGAWGSTGHSERLSDDEAARLEEVLAKFRDHSWIGELVPEP